MCVSNSGLGRPGAPHGASRAPSRPSQQTEPGWLPRNRPAPESGPDLGCQFAARNGTDSAGQAATRRPGRRPNPRPCPPLSLRVALCPLPRRKARPIRNAKVEGSSPFVSTNASSESLATYVDAPFDACPLLGGHCQFAARNGGWIEATTFASRVHTRVGSGDSSHRGQIGHEFQRLLQVLHFEVIVVPLRRPRILVPHEPL